MMFGKIGIRLFLRSGKENPSRRPWPRQSGQRTAERRKHPNCFFERRNWDDGFKGVTEHQAVGSFPKIQSLRGRTRRFRLVPFLRPGAGGVPARVEPFFNYNFGHGWFVGTAPIITANEYGTGQKWTVPVGAFAGRVIRVGKLPVKLSIGAYYNAVTPQYGATWTLQTVVAFIF
jgi:hypothetical protein